MEKQDVERVPFLLKVGIIGFFGGFLGALLGIGGSFLVIPFLSGLLGLSSHKAHATALPVAFAAGISGLGFYAESGHMNYELAIPVMLSSMVGVWAGTRMMGFVNGRLLSLLFGLFLIISAAGLAFSFNLPTEAGTAPVSFSIGRPIILGLLAGIMSGLFGAGGGIILVPGSVLVLHIAEQTAQGISLLAIIPTTLLGTWIQYKKGNISLKVGPCLTATSFAGGLLGGWAAVSLHGSILQGLLIMILFYNGARNLWKNGLKISRLKQEVRAHGDSQ